MMGNQETQHQNTKTHQSKVELSKTHKPRAKLYELSLIASLTITCPKGISY